MSDTSYVVKIQLDASGIQQGAAAQAAALGQMAEAGVKAHQVILQASQALGSQLASQAAAIQTLAGLMAGLASAGGGVASSFQAEASGSVAAAAGVDALAVAQASAAATSTELAASLTSGASAATEEVSALAAVAGATEALVTVQEEAFASQAALVEVGSEAAVSLAEVAGAAGVQVAALEELAAIGAEAGAVQGALSEEQATSSAAMAEAAAAASSLVAETSAVVEAQGLAAEAAAAEAEAQAALAASEVALAAAAAAAAAAHEEEAAAARRAEESERAAGEGAQEAGAKIGEMGEMVKGLLEVLLVFEAIDVFKESFDAAEKYQATLRQVDASLQATGGSAHVTSAELQEIAEKIEETTNFSHTAALGAENLALNFRSINGDNFERVTRDAADLAAKMGTDLPAAERQLGRALDSGSLQALSRAGVVFSQSVKDQVTALRAQGDQAAATNLILTELEKRVGGQAEAVRGAGVSWEALKNIFEGTQEEIGSGMIPAVREVAGEIATFLKGNHDAAVQLGEELGSAVKTAGEGLLWLAQNSGLVKDAFIAFAALKTVAVVTELTGAFNELVIAEEALLALNPFGLAIAAAGVLYFEIERNNDAVAAMQARFNDEQAGSRLLDDLKDRTKALSDAEYTEAERVLTLNKQRAAQIALDVEAARAKLELERTTQNASASSGFSLAAGATSAFFSGGPAAAANYLAHPPPQDESQTEQHYHFLDDELTSVNKTIKETEDNLKRLYTAENGAGDGAAELTKQQKAFEESIQKQIALLREKADATGLAAQAEFGGAAAVREATIAATADKQITADREAALKAHTTLSKADEDQIRSLTQTVADNTVQGEINKSLYASGQETLKVYRDSESAVTDAINQTSAAGVLAGEVDKARQQIEAFGTSITQEDAAALLQNATNRAISITARTAEVAAIKESQSFALSLQTAEADLADAESRTSVATHDLTVEIAAETYARGQGAVAGTLAFTILTSWYELQVKSIDATKQKTAAQLQENAAEDAYRTAAASSSDELAKIQLTSEYGSAVGNLAISLGAASEATRKLALEEAIKVEIEKEGAQGDEAAEAAIRRRITTQQDALNSLKDGVAIAKASADVWQPLQDGFTQAIGVGEQALNTWVETGHLSAEDIGKSLLDVMLKTFEQIFQKWLQLQVAMEASSVVNGGTFSASDTSGGGGGVGSYASAAGSLYKAGASYFGGGAAAATNVTTTYATADEALAAADASEATAAYEAEAGYAAVAVIAVLAILNVYASHKSTWASVDVAYSQGKVVAGDAKGALDRSTLLQPLIAGLVADANATITNLGGAITDVVGRLTLKRDGRSKNTDYTVIFEQAGAQMVADFGNDATAAMEFGAIRAIQQSTTVGLDPIISAAIKGSVAQTFKDFNADIATATQVDNLDKSQFEVTALQQTQSFASMKTAITALLGPSDALNEAFAKIDKAEQKFWQDAENKTLGITATPDQTLHQNVSDFNAAADAQRRSAQIQYDAAIQQENAAKINLDAATIAAKANLGQGAFNADPDIRQAFLDAQKAFNEAKATADSIKATLDAIPADITPQQEAQALARQDSSNPQYYAQQLDDATNSATGLVQQLAQAGYSAKDFAVAVGEVNASLVGSLAGQRDAITGEQQTAAEKLAQQKAEAIAWNAQLELDKASVQQEILKVEAEIEGAAAQAGYTTVMVQSGQYIAATAIDVATIVTSVSSTTSEEFKAMQQTLQGLKAVQDALNGIKPIDPSEIHVQGASGSSAASSALSNLKTMIDAVATSVRESGMDDYEKALDQITQKWNDEDKQLGKNKAALDQANAARQKEIDLLNQQTKASVGDNILKFTQESHGLSAWDQQLAGVGTQFAGYLKDAIAAGAGKPLQDRITNAEGQADKDLGQQAVDSLNLPLVSAAENLKKTGDALSFLTDNAAQLGFTSQQVADIVHQSSQQVEDSLADGMLQYTTDAADRTAIQQAEWDIQKAVWQEQIELAHSMKLISDDGYNALERILKGLPDAAPASASTAPTTTANNALASSATNAADALATFAESLTQNTQLSSLTPEQRLSQAQAYYEDVTSRAWTGDQAAIGQEQQAAQDYLTALRAEYGSSGEYSQLFASVIANLNALAAKFGTPGASGGPAGTTPNYGWGTWANPTTPPPTPTPPGYATGGVIYDRRLIQVGEAGPEAVIPLLSGKIPVSISGGGGAGWQAVVKELQLFRQQQSGEMKQLSTRLGGLENRAAQQARQTAMANRNMPAGRRVA